MKKLLVTLSLSIICLLCFTTGAFGYETAGTVTGNVLNGGYIAEAQGITAYVDTENNHKLLIKDSNGIKTADTANASYLNISNGKVFYISLNGETGCTLLKSYNINTGEVSVLYSVPVSEGLKNLIVSNNKAFFITGGNVTALDLSSGNITTLLKGNVMSFIPYGDSIVYTLCGKPGLFGSKGVQYAANACYFDIAADGTLYFSNGTGGIFSCDLQGSNKRKLTLTGGTNIIAHSKGVFYSYNGNLYSVDGKLASEDKGDLYNVTAGSVSSVCESIEEPDTASMGFAASALDSANYSSTTATTRKLPEGDYKEWKQSDPRWGSVAMGNTTIARAGCAATSVAILLVGSGTMKDEYLRGDFDPGVFVSTMMANGGFTSSGGIYFWKVCDIFKKDNNCFVSCSDTGKDSSTFAGMDRSSQVDAITKHINGAQEFIVIRVHNPNTGNTHFVAVDYADPDNDNVKMCDPGYSSKSGWLYTDYQIINRAIIYTYKGTMWDGGRGEGGSGGKVETVSAPVIDAKEKSAGVFEVTITCNTPGAVLYYTTDGSVPNTKCKVYKEGTPLTLTNCTLKVVAIKTGWNNSTVITRKLTGWNNPFTDVGSDKWYYGAIADAYNQNLITGYDDGVHKTFRPEGQITRAEFITILSNLISTDISETSSTDFDNFESDFNDVNSTDWFAGFIYWAVESEIAYGTSDYTFSPNAFVTREQICSFLSRFAQRSGANLKGTTNNYGTMRDTRSVSSWAKNDVELMCNTGIVAGDEQKNINPKATATRAEATAMIQRFVQKL